MIITAYKSLLHKSLPEAKSLIYHTIKTGMHLSYILLAALISFSLGNVEKTTFLAPPAISIPTAHPNLDDLSLIPLSLSHLSARTQLNASFPTEDSLKGNEHWLLLDGLSPGARYEVRICWLATVFTRPSLLEPRLDWLMIFAAANRILAIHLYASRSLQQS
jgi:hypothetical protein